MFILANNKLIFSIINNPKNFNLGINVCSELLIQRDIETDKIKSFRENYILISIIFWQIAFGIKTKIKIKKLGDVK